MLKIPNKWRELPLDERLDLPVKYFKFDSKQIANVRKIKNKRKKLIQSGRIQFQKFGEVHSFLISWIAGYGSDVEVRNVFGSTKKFRELFIKSPDNYWNVSFSWSDIKRGIKIPKNVTNDLAEEIGIHLGDGNLYVYTDKGGWKNYQCSITGDLKDESIYHENFIAPLLKKLYNISPVILKRPLKNSVDTRYHSRAIFEFKNKILGLPSGSKKLAKIPLVIFENNQLSKRCLVGIFDTDFHITSALSISGKLHSLNVARQIHEILSRNNVKHIYQVYEDYARFYIPKKESFIIVKKWGMHNPKHTSKFDVFEKFKLYLEFSTTQERLDLLDGKIFLKDLVNMCNSRRLHQ